MIFSNVFKVGGNMLHEIFLISMDVKFATFVKRALTEVKFVIPLPCKIVINLSIPNSSYIC